MNKVIEFRKVIPIIKATEDDGELYLEGQSSGPELDLDKQFMTPQCINSMADQINKSPVPYLDEHQKKGVASELGTVIEAAITPSYHLKTRTKLDRDNPNAVLLWKKVSQGKKFGQSIAGHVAELATKVIDGVVYKGFNRIVLDHIANTTKPSWAPSLGTLVAKSLESEGFDWADVSEYEGDLPFSAEVVEKGSKPDPQAGKWYTLAEDILKRLNTVFGWESYQDRIDETNRDVIPLTDLPLAATLPVGAVSLSAKDYDNDPEGYVQKMSEGMAVAMSGKAMDVKTLANIYEQLYYMADSLKRRDEQSGKKDGKKTVTRLTSAMAAVADAMKETLAKSQPVEPKTYGEPAPIPQQPEPTPQITAPHLQGDNVVRSFADVGDAGQLPQQPMGPPTPGATQPVTDFAQIAETPTVAKTTVMPSGDLGQFLGEFGDAVQKAWDADAPVDAKKDALVHIVKAFTGELGSRLESERPEEDRIERAVSKAIGPLVTKIQQLEAQLAMAKSQGVQTEETSPLVRKSLPGRQVGIQPSRIVEKENRRPTFVDLVRGEGGLLQ